MNQLDLANLLVNDFKLEIRRQEPITTSFKILYTTIYLDCATHHNTLELLPENFPKLTISSDLNKVIIFLMYNHKELGTNFVKDLSSKSSWFSDSIIIEVKKYNSLISFGKDLLDK